MGPPPYTHKRSQTRTQVHERHLTTDFLLALLRALLLQRPELRLLLMSATINCDAFADYFGGAPIVQVGHPLGPGMVNVPFIAKQTPCACKRLCLCVVAQGVCVCRGAGA